MTRIWWVKRNTFLANNVNKQQFIILMNERLEAVSLSYKMWACTSSKVCNQQSNNSSRRIIWICVAVLLPPIDGLNQTQTNTLCGISIKPRIVRTQYMHSYPIFCMQYLIDIQCIKVLELIKE